MRGRTRLVIVATAVVVLLGAAGTGIVLSVRSTDAPHRHRARVATTEVVRTDLSDSWTESGDVGYLNTRTVRGTGSGLVTWLPRTGTEMRRGSVLFRVDDRPVTLFLGSTPMFRDLDTVGLVGRDVAVVADNLTALGYDIGYRPPPGATVTVPEDTSAGTDTGTSASTDTGSSAVTSGGSSRASASADQRQRRQASGSPTAPPVPTYRVTLAPGQAVLTQSLKDAIGRWQRDIGSLPPSGVLRLGNVVVQPAPVRVDTLSARVGDAADAGVMSVSDRRKAVTVNLDVSRADGVRAGEKVRLTLPDARKISGTVGSVSTAVQSGPGDPQDSGSDSSGNGSGDQPQVAIVVRPDPTRALRSITSGQVEVRFTGTTHRGVLAVPVGALLALKEGGYALQLTGGSLVPVRVGMFADNQVEVSGTGLTAGTRVVTAP